MTYKRRIAVTTASGTAVFALAILAALLLSLTLLQGFQNLNWPLIVAGLGVIVSTSAVVYSLLRWREADWIVDTERLEKSEALFRSLVENSQDLLWEVNAEGVYTYCSPQSINLLGYRPDEIVGKTPFDLMPVEEAKSVSNTFMDCVRHKLPIIALVNINLHKNGNEVVLETSGNPILGESGELVGYRGVDRDITERRHTELDLRASEQRLRDAQLYAKLGNWELDLQTGKAYWSDEVFKILGVEREVTPGPDALRRFMNPADWPAFANSIAQVEKENASHHVEYRVTGEDGRERWIECRARPITIGDGEARRLLGVIQDVSERKRAEAEKARLQRELQQAHKMEVLGELSGGIAHDFNNLLGIILGYSELAARAAHSVGDERIMGYLDHVEKAGTRAKKLVSQLLTFSRSDENQDRPLQLSPLVREDAKMLRSTLPSSIQIALDLEEGLPSIMMDPLQLQQLLLNLSVNARDAMNGAGRLEIGLRRSAQKDAECAACHKRFSGDWLEISVSDSGGGIDDDIRGRLFDPFFTTKPVGQGTGMGLALVEGIVHRHDGHILLTTGREKSFSIRLLFPPLADAVDDTEAESEDAKSPSVQGGGGRVLVVDDEPELASYIGEILQSNGFHPVVTDSSGKALEIFATDPEAFDLLISDQTMPKLTGMELGARLREQRPELPVIICSGFSDMIDRTSAQWSDYHYMQKPISSAALIALSAELIKRQATT